MRPSGRQLDELRPVSIETGILPNAEGSCMISCGGTRVICAASYTHRGPIFRRNTGLGWVTAEYAMLPRATTDRNRRESTAGRQTGRSQEIQRLIGRSLRASIDFSAMGEHQIIVDCDVVTADGGTRCAAITGGWVALRLATDRLLSDGKFLRDPIVEQIAGISCGIYAGQPVLDLDYAEDSEAGTDANFVCTRNGGLIEVQCSSEGEPFNPGALARLLELAQQGTARLFELQSQAIGG